MAYFTAYECFAVPVFDVEARNAFVLLGDEVVHIIRTAALLCFGVEGKSHSALAVLWVGGADKA